MTWLYIITVILSNASWAPLTCGAATGTCRPYRRRQASLAQEELLLLIISLIDWLLVQRLVKSGLNDVHNFLFNKMHNNQDLYNMTTNSQFQSH